MFGASMFGPMMYGNAYWGTGDDEVETFGDVRYTGFGARVRRVATLLAVLLTVLVG